MKQKEIASATRTAILDAANKVILERGVESLTLEAVAQQAGVSKGGLLYHFPSKKKLIAGMIERQITEMDALLEEELEKSGGDFVTAYIRASYVDNPERNRVSSAMLAAITHNPELVEPLQARFAEMQKQIAAAAATPEIGTIIRLALDGLWISDLFGFAPPPTQLRAKTQAALLEIAHITQKP